MHMRSRKINLKSLQNLVDQGTQKFKKTEDNEFFLIIGNPGLRNKSEISRINYLIGNQSSAQIETNLIYPEIHITNENIILCECPDFDYNRKIEEQLCQAISLELVLKMAKKIRGILIILDYNDFYVGRGMVYRNLVERLGQLFGSNFDPFFQSAIYVIVNKPNEANEIVKNNIINNRKAEVEALQEEILSLDKLSTEGDHFSELNESSEDDDYKGQDEFYIKAKMLLKFTQLFISPENKIFVLEESDKGESRAAIISELNEAKIKSIESSQFKFDTFYNDKLKGVSFNLRKFIDDTASQIKSSELQEDKKHVVNM